MTELLKKDYRKPAFSLVRFTTEDVLGESNPVPSVSTKPGELPFTPING
ncbi:MAG: hypothetical protein II776_07115 [Clostridia bacterium]|nr:hypothetical protein [Clostridia bacterium]